MIMITNNAKFQDRCYEFENDTKLENLWPKVLNKIRYGIRMNREVWIHLVFVFTLIIVYMMKIDGSYILGGSKASKNETRIIHGCSSSHYFQGSSKNGTSCKYRKSCKFLDKMFQRIWKEKLVSFTRHLLQENQTHQKSLFIGTCKL